MVRFGKIRLRGGFGLRLAICALMALAYVYFESSFVAWLMLAVALMSLPSTLKSGEISSLAGIVVAIQLVWTVLAYLVYQLDLSPVFLTQARSLVLSADVTRTVAFISAQFLFALTGISASVISKSQLTRLESARGRRLALLLAIFTTLVINSGGSIIQGGYIGNTASYWSGLPAVFVTSISAWMLLRRRFDLRYAVILNSIVTWWLLCGNRSEILIVFLFGNYLFLKSIKLVSNRQTLQKFVLGLVMITGFYLFSLVGEIRTHGFDGSPSFDLLSAIHHVIGQDRLQFQTFGSSIYSVAVAVYVGTRNGYLYGQTFIGQLINTLPSFVSVPWERYQDISVRLRDFDILGGLGLVGEAYINFGIFGPAAIGLVFSLFLRAVIKRAPNSFLASWFILTLAMYAPRFMLYGFVYFYKLVVLFSCIYLVHAITRKKYRSQAASSES